MPTFSNFVNNMFDRFKITEQGFIDIIYNLLVNTILRPDYIMILIKKIIKPNIFPYQYLCDFWSIAISKNVHFSKIEK